MKTALSIDEKDLLLRLRNGDKWAFEQLYDMYKERLAINLFRLLKSWEEAEEILQELFIRIWENRKQIDAQKSFSAYLYRIAGNLVNDYFRKIAKDKKLVEELWLRLSELYDPDFLATQIKADEELMRTIQKLPRQRQTVFKLCKLEGKSYTEVGRILSISEAAVNDHISKANKFLREHYDKTYPILALLFCRIMMDGF